ncbi:hypothetical protein BTS2_3587 [Bacillus sp. TS-2]|nr:hypothetical protein BTS2_3587 [Bacillus sp. TS-2]
MKKQIISSAVVLFLACLISYGALTMDAKVMERHDVPRVNQELDFHVEYNGSTMTVKWGNQSQTSRLIETSSPQYKKFWEDFLKVENQYNEKIVLDNTNTLSFNVDKKALEKPIVTKEDFLKWLETSEGVILYQNQDEVNEDILLKRGYKGMRGG